MVQSGRFKNKTLLLFCVHALLFLASCRNETEETTGTAETKTVDLKKVTAPDFNADSAYAYIKAQVDFGPRVPGTVSHAKCADYLVAKLKSYGFETIVQRGTVQTFDKKQFTLKQFNDYYYSKYADDDSSGAYFIIIICSLLIGFIIYKKFAQNE